MPRVAIEQLACGRVQSSDDGGDECQAGVVLAQHAVDFLHDGFGRLQSFHRRAEEVDRGAHEEGRGDAFAAHVANDEEEVVPLAVIVVEVATHLAHRHQRRLHLDILRSLGSPFKGLGDFQYSSLDIAGNLQFFLHQLLGGLGAGVCLVVAPDSPDEPSRGDDSRQQHGQRQQRDAPYRFPHMPLRHPYHQSHVEGREVLFHHNHAGHIALSALDDKRAARAVELADGIVVGSDSLQHPFRPG